MEKLFIKVLLVTLFLSITGCFATFGGMSFSGITKCEPKSRAEERWHHFLLNLNYNMKKNEVTSFVGHPSQWNKSVEGESEYEQWIYKCQYKVGEKRFILERHLLFKDGKLIYW